MNFLKTEDRSNMIAFINQVGSQFIDFSNRINPRFEAGKVNSEIDTLGRDDDDIVTFMAKFNGTLNSLVTYCDHKRKEFIKEANKIDPKVQDDIMVRMTEQMVPLSESISKQPEPPYTT